jgi:predicted PurR-regulated permease PerM
MYVRFFIAGLIGMFPMAICGSIINPNIEFLVGFIVFGIIAIIGIFMKPYQVKRNNNG